MHTSMWDQKNPKTKQTTKQEKPTPAHTQKTNQTQPKQTTQHQNPPSTHTKTKPQSRQKKGRSVHSGTATWKTEEQREILLNGWSPKVEKEGLSTQVCWNSLFQSFLVFFLKFQNIRVPCFLYLESRNHDYLYQIIKIISTRLKERKAPMHCHWHPSATIMFLHVDNCATESPSKFNFSKKASTHNDVTGFIWSL